ncbi:hypothetical protein C8Q74DRAFT_1296217 [Fomes fomentarius]|nr:hypothetical protein C8Q74DRAFT_1296217 [Fomes fomentarius]
MILLSLLQMLGKRVMGLGLFSSCLLLVRGQEGSSNVTCLADYDWMDNSNGQNPCLVAAWSLVPCHSTGWTVQRLQSGQQYLGPSATNEPALYVCACNTVVYSLHAACAFCQGLGNTENKGIANWTEWKENCPSVQFGRYPQNIPDQTAIPAWAYNVDLNADKWDESAALDQAQKDLPESTHSGQASQTGVQSPTATQDGSQHRSIVGPAVGGTLGGIVGLLGIAVGAWLYLRHRRSRSRVLPTVEEPEQGAATDLTIDNSTQGGHGEKPILYNPDDPRTYPSRLSWTIAGLEGLQSSTTENGGGSNNPIFGHGMRYTGVPEI